MPKKLARIPMKARISEIESVYASATEKITAVLSSLDLTTFSTTAAGMVLTRVKTIIASLDSAVQMWAPGTMRAAFDESAGVARIRLEALGLDQKKDGSRRQDKKIAALTKTIMTDYWKANRTIERAAKKYLVLAAQAAAGVAKIEEVQAFTGAEDFPYIKRILKGARPESWTEATLARQAVAKKIMDHLLKKIGGGDFILINGRNYNLKAYAELVARTRMREAQTEATKELCKEFDNDLVQFSKHDSPCEVCAPLEGQVFSISGDDPKYPALTDEETPPIHPCCGHNINPTSENALSWRNA